jgi:putative transposase
MAELDDITLVSTAFPPHTHLVYVTKFRHTMFEDRHLARTEETTRAVCTDFETELVELNGKNNHVHLLGNFPPTVDLATLVNSLTGVSSRRMRQEFPDLRPHYYQTTTPWSGSYLAGPVGGPPLSTVRQHIEQQNRPVQGTARAWRPSQREPSPPP